MSHSTCNHCGQPLDEAAQAPGTPRYCRHCGTEIAQELANEVPPPYGAPSYDTPPIPPQLPPPTPSHYPYAPGSYAPAIPDQPATYWLTPARAFLFSLLLGGVALLLKQGGSLLPSDSSASIAYDIGAMFGFLLGPLVIAAIFALLIAGIAALFSKPFSRTFPRFFALLIIAFATLNLVGSLITVGTSKRLAKKEEARQFASDLERDLGQFIESTQDADGIPRESNFHLETTPGRNEMERARNLIASYLNDMAALQNEYLASLDKAGLNSLLDPNRLAKDTDYKESRKIIEDSKACAIAYTKKARAAVNSMPKRVKNAPGPEREKKEFLKGYEESVKRSMPLFEEVWDLEVKSVDYFTTIIDIFEEAHGSWSTQDETFMFEQEKHSDAFNKVLSDLQAGLARQQEIQQQMQSESMRKVNDLKQEFSR
jgi:hypothetical protein